MIWDGSPIHRRAEVKEFVAEAGGAIRLEPLPAYAPDLNPVEWLWNRLSAHLPLNIFELLDGLWAQPL